MPTEKTCTGCGQVRSLTTDNWHRDRTKRDGFATRCKPCRNANNVARHLMTKYGLSLAEWERISESQGGVCAVCEQESDERLNVDHCHKHKHIRGLLCRDCNTALGLLKEQPEIIARAAIYVARNEGGA